MHLLRILALMAQVCAVLTTDAELCENSEGTYKCKRLTRHQLADFPIPQQNCHFQSCHDCLKVWRTVIVHNNQTTEPIFFVEQQKPSEHGPRTLINCKKQGLPCVCSAANPCSGTASYCQLATCANDSAVDCYCRMEPAKVTLIHRTSEGDIPRPILLSYRVCAAKWPGTPSHRQRHRRHILTDEEAVFQHGGITMTYVDPVLTLSGPGVLIVRIRGYERMMTLKEAPYQATVPPELLTESAEMKLIFVTTDGKSLKGSVHIVGRSMCPPLNCVLCYDLLIQLKCLPSAVSYVVYGLLILLTAIIFLYLKAVLMAVWKILYGIGYVTWRTYRLIRGSTLLAVKTGAATGIAVRNRAQVVNNFVERLLAQPQVQAPLPGPATLALLAMLLCVDAAAAECNSHTVVTSKARECIDSGTEKTCRLTTTAQVTLMNLDYQQCLWFTDEEEERNLFSLKLTFEGATCEWQTTREYYTFVTAMRHLSELQCSSSSQCSWGKWCVKGKEFPALTKQSLEWPGVTNCFPSDSGSAPCFIIDSQHCHFYRIWLEADFLQSYEVRRIVGMQCRFKISVQQQNNDSVEALVVRSHAVTSTGIAIQILGSFDQPTEIVNTHLVTRVGDPQMSFLEKVSPVGRPTAGYIGDIQANESITKNFIFDEKMFSCQFYEDSMRCQRQISYLTTMIETKKNALPMTTAWHHFKIDSSGRLISEMLQSAPIVVNLQFHKYKFSLETKTVCPKFGDAEIQISGCYSCDLLATMTFDAYSSCAPGMIDVHFELISVHTRSLYLSTERTHLKVQFKTDIQCTKEKLCLHGRTVSTCKVVDFCLEQPKIHLKHPNTSYIISKSITGNSWSQEWWLDGWTFSATAVTKLVVAALTCIILILFLVSTFITCCRG